MFAIISLILLGVIRSGIHVLGSQRDGLTHQMKLVYTKTLVGIGGTASRTNINYYRLWEKKPGYIENQTEFLCDLTAPVLCVDP